VLAAPFVNSGLAKYLNLTVNRDQMLGIGPIPASPADANVDPEQETGPFHACFMGFCGQGQRPESIHFAVRIVSRNDHFPTRNAPMARFSLSSNPRSSRSIDRLVGRIDQSGIWPGSVTFDHFLATFGRRLHHFRADSGHFLANS